MSSPKPTSWSRLIRFIATEDSKEHYGQPLDGDQDVGLCYSSGKVIKVRKLIGNGPLDPLSKLSEDQVLTVKQLLSPLSPNEVGAIRALGANYAQGDEDLREAKSKRPIIPILFHKPPKALSGPGQPILVPKLVENEADYEVELVVVISKDCKDVPPERALDYVLGYTLSNDVSARKRMFSVHQWGLGKGFDGWLPIGPVLVSSSHRQGLRDPDNVDLRTKINGEVVQDGNTSRMLWACAETISELSKGTTLEAGSIISMGTPPGEGFKKDPPRFLQDGDVCELWGGNGIGTLINPVRFQSRVGSPSRARL
ncbi:hypothetical protein IE53DRAFT_383837 [Violaceomyces palustris]|uniref:Uncharacterized protein n=1 Tax=Violaceomyces palustris TaxID=1673888 RepID=A0ACD0P6L3_9BASI|nr:hypothetical protein IE53DRAFT_383837 [Violaceomyces palustris]